MADDHDSNDRAAKVLVTTINYAVEQTGTPSDRLTRNDFMNAAVLAEESGDMKLTQRLLLLAEDRELQLFED